MTEHTTNAAARLDGCICILELGDESGNHFLVTDPTDP